MLVIYLWPNLNFEPSMVISSYIFQYPLHDLEIVHFSLRLVLHIEITYLALWYL
jgi:hypothetical protein